MSLAWPWGSGYNKISDFVDCRKKDNYQLGPPQRSNVQGVFCFKMVELHLPVSVETCLGKTSAVENGLNG